MENAGAITGNDGANVAARCAKCGFGVARGARFCANCGVAVLGQPKALENLGGSVALVITIVWVVLVLLLASEPMSGYPNANRAALQQFVLTLGLFMPWLLVLSIAAVAVRRSGNRTLGPGVTFLVVMTWWLVSSFFTSEPGVDFLAAILYFVFTLGAVGCWLVFILPTCYRAWKVSRSGGLGKIAAYVLPLAVAAALFVAPGPEVNLLKARFDASEAAMFDEVEKFESSRKESVSRSHRVGLYKIDVVHRRDGCVILKTGGWIDYEAGFAYCTGPLPTSSTVHMKHVKGDWWIYENVH
jgi:hypothetical protein